MKVIIATLTASPFMTGMAATLLFLMAVVVSSYPAPRDCSTAAEMSYYNGRVDGARLVLKKFNELEASYASKKALTLQAK